LPRSPSLQILALHRRHDTHCNNQRGRVNLVLLLVVVLVVVVVVLVFVAKTKKNENLCMLFRN